MLAKLTDTQVSENLETQRKGEKFTLIEPPQVPEKPVSPNRLLIIVAGLALSLAIGVGAAAAHESFDASVRGPTDIRALLQIPALASIPVIVTTEDRIRRRTVARYSWVGGIACIALACATVHFLVKPLDVVWAILMRRLGV
jgi:hypothetical protein